jgi:hypothetical protein
MTKLMITKNQILKVIVFSLTVGICLTIFMAILLPREVPPITSCPGNVTCVPTASYIEYGFPFGFQRKYQSTHQEFNQTSLIVDFVIYFMFSTFTFWAVYTLRNLRYTKSH